MTLPDLPVWATDATFNAPGDPWDGDPTKVVAAAGKLAQGWEPTEAPPAEYLNDWQNKVYQWLEAVANVPLNNWDFTYQEEFYDGTYVANQNIHSITRETTKLIAAGDAGAGDRIFVSYDGKIWLRQTHPVFVNMIRTHGVVFSSEGDGLAGPRAIAFSKSNDDFLRSTDGITWTADTAASSFDNFEDAIRVPAFNKWIACGPSSGSGQDVARSTTGAVPWLHSDPGFGGTDIPKRLCLGEDGASNPRVVAVGENGKYAYSDDGIAWTFGGQVGTKEWQAIVWDPYMKRFIMATNDGDIATSSNGSSWVTQSSVALPAYTTSFPELAVDDRGTVLLYKGDNGLPGRAYVSRDAGQNFVEIMGNQARNGGGAAGLGGSFWFPSFGWMSCGLGFDFLAHVWRSVSI